MALKTQQVKPLSMRAAVGTANAEKRTVEVVFSTGAKVLRSSWLDGSFYEELDMSAKAVRLDRLNNGAPFLMDHNGYRVSEVPAVVESARLEGGKGYATVRFASKGIDPAADMLFEKIQDGIVRSVSVGYRVHKVEKIVTEGEKVPTMRVVDWTPYEISAVAMPADAGAGFRSDELTNECEVITTRGSEPQQHNPRNAMDPEEIKRQEAAALAKRQAEEQERTAKVLADERARVAGITHAVRAAKLDDGKLIDKLIADGTTVDAARAQVLELMVKRDEEAPTDSKVTGVEGQDQRDKFVRGVSAWLFEKAGDRLVERAHKMGAKGFEKIELDGGEFRGATLEQVARLCLRRAGIKNDHIFDRKRIIDMAFRASTTDFAVLFENVMNKSMRAAYATVENTTWRRFAGVDTVSDFRDSHRFLNGQFGTLPVVAENAEFQQQEIPDGSKLSINTETRGAIIALSRQAMINDDMNALTSLVTAFGATAARTIESEVYRLLALNGGLGPTMDDTNPFFHDATRGNVNTSSVLGVAGLDSDRVKMGEQMDISEKDYLDLIPSILLVPNGLAMQAKILNTSATDPLAGTAQGLPNGVQGMFQDIVSTPRLSGTRRYLFTGSKEAIKVVFLEGSGEGPVLESQDGFEVDGTQWKARIDVKVNFFDGKHALTSAGTA